MENEIKIYKKFQDEMLEAELKKLNDECKKLRHNLKETEEIYYKKSKEYSDIQIRKTFKDGVCSSCYNKLSPQEIQDQSIYCYDCMETDSCLAYNCHDIEF